MSWTEDIDLVEKAAQEVHRAIEEYYEEPEYAVPWEALAEFERGASRKAARAVLVAVGPHIAEAAWDEGQKSGARWGGPPLDAYEPDPPSTNPYRQEAGR